MNFTTEECLDAVRILSNKIDVRLTALSNVSEYLSAKEVAKAFNRIRLLNLIINVLAMELTFNQTQFENRLSELDDIIDMSGCVWR